MIFIYFEIPNLWEYRFYYFCQIFGLNTTIAQIYISTFFHNLYYFYIFNLFIYFLRIYILYYSFLKSLNIALNTKYSICFKGKKKHKKNKFHYPVMTTKEEHIFHVHLHEIYISVLTSSFEYLPSQLSK